MTLDDSFFGVLDRNDAFEKKNDQLSLSSKILTKLMCNTIIDDNGNLVVQAAAVVSGI